MKVLILYATIEGQTGKIARYAADQIRKLGHDVDLVDADESTEIEFNGVEAVILAGSVHQRRHPRNFEALISGFKDELAARKTLLLSISLNAAFAEGLEEAHEYVTEMKMRTGLAPDAEHLVAGAVRTDNYDYFAMQVIRHVVLRNRDHDPSSGEHEFTDYDTLSAEITKFLS